jgi:hypothetical protein
VKSIIHSWACNRKAVPSLQLSVAQSSFCFALLILPGQSQPKTVFDTTFALKRLPSRFCCALPAPSTSF